jgi:hypothetical protein
MRAWGFAVGLAIAWFVGLALACTRFGEANRRHSIFVVAPHPSPATPRGHLFR